MSSGADAREEADLVVVGAGAAGMTAALVAASEGLRVVLCEATFQVGGTTATSAGTLWVPGNPHAARAGHADTVAAAATYLEAILGPDDARGLRRTFLATAAEALDYLEQRSALAFTSAGMHPDYLALPGAGTAGRAVAPLPFDGRELGADFARVRPPIREFLLLGGMMAGKADVRALAHRFRTWPDFLHSARLVARYALDRLRHPRGTRLVMGNALVARLLQSLRRGGVDLRFGWRLRELVADGGRVTGAWFETGAGPRRLDARAGVVLASGGVGHGEALRRSLGAAPDLPSLACASVRGDGLEAACRAGARLERHGAGNFFWQPVSRVPHGDGVTGFFPHLYLDRAKPGLIAVDGQGRRFVDEAASYHHFVARMLEAVGTPPEGRVFLVCDAAFVRRYGLGVIPPGTRKLARWVRSGYVTAAPSLRELARRVGIAEDGLLATVERCNAFAASGKDLDFGKGDAVLGRFNGDPDHRPNPCLGTIAQAPFYALPLHAADAASSAGLATDRDGQVLDDEGQPIPGLYACGNDAASVMRGSYPGPGITLGPAMVFAYRIGRHAGGTLAERVEGKCAEAGIQGIPAAFGSGSPGFPPARE